MEENTQNIIAYLVTNISFIVLLTLLRMVSTSVFRSTSFLTLGSKKSSRTKVHVKESARVKEQSKVEIMFL